VHTAAEADGAFELEGALDRSMMIMTRLAAAAFVPGERLVIARRDRRRGERPFSIARDDGVRGAHVLRLHGHPPLEPVGTAIAEPRGMAGSDHRSRR